ncbi:MAG: hypothetical protein GY880_23980 [Planctomycetaceae bacterium]|nr:hypothetical protein [Planctomycetaceae bacterium]
MSCSIGLFKMDVSLQQNTYLIVVPIVAVVELDVLNDTLPINGCFESLDEWNKMLFGLFL